jgi:hypothetical protein
MSRESRLLAGFLLGVLTAWCLMCLAGRAEEIKDAEGMAKKIAAAWKQRAAAIKSLHLEATAKVTTMVTETKPGDPFDTPIDPDGPWRPVIDDRQITYSLGGEKRATSMTGNQWNSDLRASKYTAFRCVFDGREYAFLFESGAFRHGSIGNGRFASGPLDGSWLQPVHLFLDPGLTLEKRGYRLEHAKTRFYETTYAGTACVEARMPLTHKDRVSSRIGIAYLDPKIEYRFLAFLTEDDGTPVVQYAFKYASNPRSGWLLSKWTADSKSGSRYEVRVKRALVNEPIDEKLFKMAFPVGTEIVEETKAGGTKHYIQEADGSRRPISDKEFKERHRRTPGNQPATSAA